MKLETAGIDAREKVLAEPWNDERQRSQAGYKEPDEKSPPVMQAAFQQPAVATSERLETRFEFLLKSGENISPAGNVLACFLATQQVLSHGGDDRA